LGIFVSGKVAKKEHTQIVSVLKYIQQLPPSLYGMEIEEVQKTDGEVEYDVSLHERRLEDLKKMQKHDRVDEKPFEAVAALSELNERAYELLLRPAIREATSEWMAKLVREWHPLRASHWMFSDRNPMLAWLPFAAALAQTYRHPRAVPAVRQVLDELDRGGLPEAVIRAGMLIAKAGSGVRRLAQMEHTRELLEPPASSRG